MPWPELGILSGLGSKAQHSKRYSGVPAFLRSLREDAGLTQRELGELLGKPHSWIYNSETGNRRVDVAEFVDWSEACGVEPMAAFEKLFVPKRPRGGRPR